MDGRVATEQEQKDKNNCPGCGNRPTFHEKTESNTAMAGGTAKDQPDLWVLESATVQRLPWADKSAWLSPG